MSVVISMTSVAIIVGMSVTQTAMSAILIAATEGQNEEVEKGLETGFVDCNILVKSLNNMDCHIKQNGENEILVETTCGILKYARESNKEPFKIYFNDITDVDGLLENIRELEQDYGRNVQDYTYHHIKDNLTDDMTIVEEQVLEDDSLYLTINID